MAPLIRVADIFAGEADPFAEVVLTLSAASTETITVTYATGSATADYNVDFAYSSGTIAFAAGETTKTVRVPLITDNKVEPSEVFLFNLSYPSNAQLERTSSSITIVDNDKPTGTPLLSLGDAVVDEKAGLALLPVSLDRPSSGTVSVSYATGGGSATANADYTAQAGQLVFKAGETSKTIAILLNDDNVAEASELFNVLLSSPAAATIADGTGGVLLGASDGSTLANPLIRVADFTVAEADPFAEVVLTLSAASTETITVTYATGSATADYNVDFAYSSGTIAFAAGETTKTVRVPLITDNKVEPSEVFLFNLSYPSNAQLERTSSSITIVDNDGATNILSGGISDDTYTVDSPNDVVIESSIGGKDTVLASISYTLPSHVENLTLTGKRGIRATGNALDNQISGNSGNNLLKGLKGKDSLDGGLGDDTLTGGAGNDTLTGSAGADVFRFDAALNDAKNRDSLTDFNPAEGDGIQLENSIFSALGIPGSLPSEAFAFGARARNFSQHILYNVSTGALAYDQDGDGPIAAIRFAVLSPGLALKSSAFTVT